MFRILLLGIFLCVITVANTSSASDYYVPHEDYVENQEDLYKQYRQHEDDAYLYPLYFN